MKSTISKLKKPYSLYISPRFEQDSNSQISLISEPSFYSISYMLPSQKFVNKGFIKVPLDLMISSKKNLLLKYSIDKLCHQTRSIFGSLTQFRVMNTGLNNIAYPKNLSLVHKSESFQFFCKILLNSGNHPKKNCIAIKKKIQEMLNKFSDMPQLLKLIHDRQGLKALISELDSEKMIKSLNFTRVIKL